MAKQLKKTYRVNLACRSGLAAVSDKEFTVAAGNQIIAVNYFRDNGFPSIGVCQLEVFQNGCWIKCDAFEKR